MENKTIVEHSNHFQFMVIIILTLIASMLPEIIFRELTGSFPDVISFLRLILIILAGVIAHYLKREKIMNYCVVLSVIVAAEMIMRMIFFSSAWQEAFDMNAFVGKYGASILLRMIGAIPVIVILIVLLKSTKSVYLVKGDLSVKADEIKWLGIKKEWISWGKLAIISAVLISLGTILLTMLTVTGASSAINLDGLLKYFPFVIVFALFNSLSEGIVYRSAILGSLKNVLPKHQVIFIAALIFGIGHYYGAPSGFLGVLMSGVLGWYMSRSMYETEGFATSWVIHFMQDAVIFSTILLMS